MGLDQEREILRAGCLLQKYQPFFSCACRAYSRRGMYISEIDAYIDYRVFSGGRQSRQKHAPASLIRIARKRDATHDLTCAAEKTGEKRFLVRVEAQELLLVRFIADLSAYRPRRVCLMVDLFQGRGAALGGLVGSYARVAGRKMMV